MPGVLRGEGERGRVLVSRLAAGWAAPADVEFGVALSLGRDWSTRARSAFRAAGSGD